MRRLAYKKPISLRDVMQVRKSLGRFKDAAQIDFAQLARTIGD